MNEHVSFKRADAAVQFVRDNAEKYGSLVGAVKGLEHQRKIVRAMQVLESEKKTVADREADAESSPDYKSVVKEIQDTWAEKATLETLMKAAEMTFDLYRSSNKWSSP